MKTKKLLIIIEDENALNDIILQRALLELSVTKNTAEMNKEILDIKTKYEPAIDKANAKIKEYENAIVRFCKTNKKKLFGKTKTLELTYGSIQNRLGNYSLKPISGETKKTVTKKLFELFKDKFVDVTLKLKANTVIDAYKAEELTNEQLKLAGAEVKQGESYIININWDEIKTPDKK